MNELAQLLDKTVETVTSAVNRCETKEQQQQFLTYLLMDLSSTLPGCLFDDSLHQMQELWKEQKSQHLNPKIKPNLTDSEQKILNKIRRYVGQDYRSYSFWFIYDHGEAVNWEGEYDMTTSVHFRNQYTIRPNTKIVQNWE